MSNSWEKVYFQTHAHMKNIIGKELINDDNVAVMELVKNSYDAGASRVDVIFKNLFYNNDDKVTKIDDLTNKTSQIIIKDNGIGMSRKDIIDKWLNIAYSSKKLEHTQNNRYQAGNKGVGRFSCDRLGEFLNIYTKLDNEKIQWLQISWKDFEQEDNANIQIQEIPLNFKEISDEDFNEETGIALFEKGTILQIIKLNSVWAELEEVSLIPKINKTKLMKLKNSLERLINPNQSYDTNSFKIYLNVKELDEENSLPYYEKVSGKIENQIFEKLDFRTTFIESFITEDGSKIVTELKDKNKTIFRLIEKNTEYPLLKDIKIVLYYLNPYAKAYFKRQTGIRSVEFGSIFLFLNGFRVSPYGDADNDWIGLEQRKTQGIKRNLSGRELIGRIELKDFENRYRVISSREGIVHTAAYKQLVSDFTKSKHSKYNGFYYKIHRRLEKYVVEGLDWDKSTIDENEIEKLVEHDTWDETQEKYTSSSKVKLNNSSDSIYSILGIKSKEVIDLYINEELIESLIEEDSEKSNEKLQKFLKNYTSLSSSSLDEKTKVAISKLTKSIQDEELAEKFRQAIKAKKEVEKELKEEKKSQQELYKLYKKEKREAKKLIKQQEQQNKQILFLQSIQTLDKEQLLNLQHHIGLYSHDIEGAIISFKRAYNRNSNPTQKQIFDFLDRLTLANKKVLTINKLATKSNFLTDSELINEDIVSFINEYINTIYLVEDNRKISINVNTNDNIFKTEFSPFEITIVLDNLLHNAKRVNKPKKVIVDINILKEENNLIIEFSNNGKGLDLAIKNSSQIFEQGFTTTEGSGLGLYHVKKILEKIGFKIEVNDKYEDGFQLKIYTKGNDET